MAASFAALLRTWRERALLSQEQLAGRAGLGVRTVRRLESDGAHRPHGESVRRVADALELSEVERAQLVAAARGEEVGAAGGSPRPPRQLPADVTGFTGRVEQLRRLDDLLVRDGAAPKAVVISAIAGTAGVGKTALAVHWAHRVAGHFRDGQLYVNLRGFDPSGTPTDPATALCGFLDALGVPSQHVPVGLDAQAALYRSLLADRRTLVVLDNARDADQVRPLLPGAPGCLAVVTSRNQLTGLVAGEGACPVSLDLLTTVEARELLTGRVGADRAAAEPEAVDEIIAWCARLPLALAVAAARAATRPDMPLARLATELCGARERLDAFDTGDAATDVRAVFSWSYHRLRADEARLFRLLGLHPGPDVSVPAAASLAGTAPRRAQPVLTELSRAHLVTEPTPGRYGLHDLLRAYAGEQAHLVDTDEQRRAAVHRMLDHYLHTAHSAARLLNPHRIPVTPPPLQPGVTCADIDDHGQALRWFSAEHRTLQAAIQAAARCGFDPYAWQLAWTLVDFLDRRGHWFDWTLTQTVALEAAQRTGDREGQAHARRSLGRASARTHCYDSAHAHLRQALTLFGELGHRTGQARTHLDLSAVLSRWGRHHEALSHAEHALDLYRAAGHQDGQARALNAVGWDHAQLGDHDQALHFCEQALALHTTIGDPAGQAATWDSLGYIHHSLGHPTRAAACYEHAGNLYQELGDRYNEAQVLTLLGEAHHAAGGSAAARDAWTRALAILDGLDHPDANAVRARLEKTSRGR